MLKSLSIYGPLGVVFFIYIKENFKRQSEMIRVQSEKELKNQENYQQLLNTVINTSNENIKRLEGGLDKLSSSIDKANKFYDLGLEDISESILKIKDNCNTNYSQLFTSIYEEKGLPKSVFGKMLSDISIMKVYQSIIDITTTIDSNGFDNEENVCLLKDNLIRIIEKRRHEALDEISKLNFDQETLKKISDECHILYVNHLAEFKERIINTISPSILASDKNYKRLKSTIKNLVFAYLDDLIKMQNDLLR